MKKLASLFLILLVGGLAFYSCSDTKTYAEMLEDEKKAIKKFIKDNNIKVITATEFSDNGNETNVSENEFVQLSNGVYMQIVDRGNGDSIRNRDIVTVRFVEYDILKEDTTGASNFAQAQFLDSFDYTITDGMIYGQFRKENGEYGAFYIYYNSVAVPEGWLTCLPYIKNNARVKLIVPSKKGHQVALEYAYPYYYDLRRIRIY